MIGQQAMHTCIPAQAQSCDLVRQGQQDMDDDYQWMPSERPQPRSMRNESYNGCHKQGSIQIQKAAQKSDQDLILDLSFQACPWNLKEEGKCIDRTEGSHQRFGC